MNGNEFSVTPPSSNMFGSSGPTQDEYHQINEAIYGSPSNKDKSNQSTNTNTNKTDTKNNSFSSSTTKHYISPNNPTGWNIPMDKIDQFLKDNPDAQEAK
jgi:hypothetical protein